MTLNKALEINKTILDQLESTKEGTLLLSPYNSRIFREYMVKSVMDSGFVALGMLINFYWVVEEKKNK